jgi:hypothetical protein
LNFPGTLFKKKIKSRKSFHSSLQHYTKRLFISFTEGVHKFAGNLRDTKILHPTVRADPQVLGGTVQHLFTTPPGAWDVCTPDLQNIKTL